MCVCFIYSLFFIIISFACTCSFPCCCNSRVSPVESMVLSEQTCPQLVISCLSCHTVSPRGLKDYKSVRVKLGSSAELPCVATSNLAQVIWKANGTVLTETSSFLLMGEGGLLIYSVGPEDQGQYDCWSIEWAPAVGKNFTRLLASYVLTLDLPPRSPHQTQHTATTQDTSFARATERNGKTDRDPVIVTVGTSIFSATVQLTSPPQTDPSLTQVTGSTIRIQPKHHPPSSKASDPDSLAPKAKYLEHSNSNVALLLLFLLFFLLFSAALVYNCYMQYLPAPCLRLRAALLGSHKSEHQPEYRACEAGLMEASAADKINMTEQPTLNGSHTTQKLQALRDTGYETEPEPEYGNGQIHCHNSGEESSCQEKPFDVDCESQPIQFADADEPYC